LILDSFQDIPVLTLDPLDDPTAVLPPPGSVRGAVFMGGPMSANDAEHNPALQRELDWLADALTRQVPLLGICLGAQLIAKAAGSTINRATRPEIGVSPVHVLAGDDPLAAALGPTVPALHWHGEELTLPPGATHLARSDHTDVQAFRLGTTAWGLQFHLEADHELVETWLADPGMAAEAKTALGPDYAERLRRDLNQLDRHRARQAFDVFAARCTAHADPMPA
jgi:GMP synthase (glutamine-hydrolysing)